MIGAMEVDPTLGLYSPTAAGQGNLAQDALMAGLNEIVQGRRPIADMDSLVVEWRQKVGDKIRGEFQDALAAVAKA
jgi:putative aldouronate transport system substrate-binding protein